MSPLWMARYVALLKSAVMPAHSKSGVPTQANNYVMWSLAVVSRRDARSAFAGLLHLMGEAPSNTQSLFPEDVGTQSQVLRLEQWTANVDLQRFMKAQHVTVKGNRPIKVFHGQCNVRDFADRPEFFLLCAWTGCNVPLFDRLCCSALR